MNIMKFEDLVFEDSFVLSFLLQFNSLMTFICYASENNQSSNSCFFSEIQITAIDAITFYLSIDVAQHICEIMLMNLF